MPAVHRKGDATGGHGSWVPNSAKTGSEDVFANGIGVVRKTTDKHVGHASPTPGAFHQYEYDQGSPNVFTNGKPTVRIGDETICTDPAVAGSNNVFVNGE